MSATTNVLPHSNNAGPGAQPRALGEYSGRDNNEITYPGGGSLTSSLPSVIGAGGQLDHEFGMRFKEAYDTFGPPPNLAVKDPRQLVGRDMDALPEIWAGRLPKVTEEIILFRNTALIDIIVKVAPISQFDGNPVRKLRQVLFHGGRPDDYTHTGVPRLVFHSFKEWQSSIPRRGLGLEMEAEFFGTQEGKRVYTMSIKQIQTIMMQSLGVEVISLLVRTPRPPVNFYEAHRTPIPYNFLQQAMNMELQRWGCIQKNQNGLMMLASSVREQILQAKGKSPTVCILPAWFKDYVRFNTPAFTSFLMRGPKGPEAFDNNTVLSQALAGLELVECPSIDNELGEKPEEPLNLPRTIGGHWFATGKHLDHVTFTDLNRYLAARAIVIHDNDSDNFATLSLQAVANYLALFNGSEDYQNLPASLRERITTFVAAVKGVDELDQPLPPADCIAALKKIGLIYLRPYETWVMASAIFTLGGGAAVRSLVGYGDFRLSNDGIRKKVFGHYTGYYGCELVDPNSIYVAHNVGAVEYAGGGGSKLGVDIFPILVDIDDPVVQNNSFVLPIGEHGFPPGLVEVDTHDRITYENVADWAGLYNFAPGGKGNLLDVDLTNAQEFINTRTFLQPCYVPTCGPDGTILNPRGEKLCGNCHWGNSIYPGVREDRLGRGTHGRVIDTDVSRIGL